MEKEAVEVDVCISQTLHRNTTIATTDYEEEVVEDCEEDEDGFRTVRRLDCNFANSNLLSAYKETEWTILELLEELSSYIRQDLNKGCSVSRRAWLEKLLKACEGWELDEEEVVEE